MDSADASWATRPVHVPPPTSSLSSQELAALLATPAGTAWLASRGRWVPARHLRLLSLYLVALATRRIRRLLVLMPPRHGKSSLVSEWFPFWYLAWNPFHRVILTSYETRYAEQWGQRVRDHLNEHGPSLFGVSVSNQSSARAHWDIDVDEAVSTFALDTLAGPRLDLALVGGMNAAGAGGAITGKGANLLLIDDPVKNEAEARSELMQQNQWEWLQQTAMTRLEPDGVVGIVMTHWHLEDIAGRIARGDLGGDEGVPWTILKMPAIATEDEPEWPTGIGRTKGEALWPERYPLERLKEIEHGEQTIRGWSALYQQSPIPEGGSVFKAAWFDQWYDTEIPKSLIRKASRFWDTAATQDGGDWTVGTLVFELMDGSYAIDDVVRGQWDPPGVEARIQQVAAQDAFRFGGNSFVAIREEQEPGASGKAVVTARGSTLRGYNYKAAPAHSDKETRAYPLATQCGLHNVKVRKANWNKKWLDEVLLFPNGSHDDQVDSASGGFNELHTVKRGLQVAPVRGG